MGGVAPQAFSEAALMRIGLGRQLWEEASLHTVLGISRGLECGQLKEGGGCTGKPVDILLNQKSYSGNKALSQVVAKGRGSAGQGHRPGPHHRPSPRGWSRSPARARARAGDWGV
jgi:hypothetical protein